MSHTVCGFVPSGINIKFFFTASISVGDASNWLSANFDRWNTVVPSLRVRRFFNIEC